MNKYEEISRRLIELLDEEKIGNVSYEARIIGILVYLEINGYITINDVSKPKQNREIVSDKDEGIYEIPSVNIPSILPSLPRYVPYNEPCNPRKIPCSLCGIDLSQPLGYVCNRKECPSGLGGTVWMSGNEGC